MTCARWPMCTSAGCGWRLSPLAADRLQQACEVGLEGRVGDGGGLHAVDLDGLAARQARDRAEHGQAVVAVRGDHAAAQLAGPADDEAVRSGLDVRAEAAQAVDHGGDPVRLLD